MNESCFSGDQYVETCSNYDTTKEIQKFLIKNLQLTPRRQLFEEYVKTLTIDRKNEVNNQQTETCVPSKPTNKFELNIITELSEFRRKHPKECMTDLNHRRFRRAKEREEEFLQHSGVQRLVLNDGLIQSLINAGSCRKDENGRSKTPVEKMRSRTRSVHFAPDNSLALSYQKFKL